MADANGAVKPYRVEFGRRGKREFKHRPIAEDFYLAMFALGFTPRMFNQATGALMFSEDPRDDRKHRGLPMMVRVFTWDWKDQPDLDAIGEAVTEMSVDFDRVYMREIKDTGGDFYMVVVSSRPVTDTEAMVFLQ